MSIAKAVARRTRGARAAFPAALLAAGMLMACAGAFAHGGLSMDEDQCKLRVGSYLMHFVGYQPDSASGPKEFCEDIPETGRTVVVLDYLNDELRDLPTEVRIVRDTGSEAKLDEITVLHLPAKVYPSGSLSFELSFPEAGKFVGLVTVHDKQPLVSRFPFSVGKPGSNWPLVVGGVLVVMAAVGLYRFGVGRRARKLSA